MNWKDNRQTNTTEFGQLKIGDVFVCTDIIYIKINRDEAFDICNNAADFFNPNDKVEKRKATLVLD